MNTERSAIYVITGGIGSGKSTLAVRLSQMARERGFTVGGIIAHRRLDKKSGAIEYWTECLQGGKSWLFATTRQSEIPLAGLVNSSTHQLGNFYFPLAGIRFASRCLRRSAHCDYVFIDELGPLELSGGGLWRATRFLLDNSSARLILIIRRPLLNEVLSALHVRPHIIIDTGAVHARSFYPSLKKFFA